MEEIAVEIITLIDVCSVSILDCYDCDFTYLIPSTHPVSNSSTGLWHCWSGCELGRILNAGNDR